MKIDEFRNLIKDIPSDYNLILFSLDESLKWINPKYFDIQINPECKSVSLFVCDKDRLLEESK